MDNIKKAVEKENHKYDDLPWKAWGSWFSWGSPVGLGLGWALILVSTGTFLYLLHLAGLVGMN